jgi:hypothetical protein
MKPTADNTTAMRKTMRPRIAAATAKAERYVIQVMTN